MNFKRIGRTLICLLMVCALLVNVSPIRAEATAAGLLGSIAGVTSVNVPAGLVYGAAAIALGVAVGANDDFQNIVDSAVSSGTEWVKDGTVELLRVVDAAGNAAYFAASSFMESVRQWLFDSKTVESVPLSYEHTFNFSGQTYTAKADVPFAIAVFKDTYWGSAYVTCFGSELGTVQVFDSSGKIIKTENLTGNSFRYSNILSCSVNSISTSLHVYDYWHSGTKFPSLSPSSPFDIRIGSVPTVPIDGSSALDWAPEYQANRLYVTGGSNDPEPPDENNGKWFWPLALTLTAADLYLMSQADEWSGETPQEFDNYTQNTEYEIVSRPEFDGYTGIEISPKPDQNPDTGENPDIGGDTGTDEDAETTWFQRIVKGIEELPSKFGSWFDKILEWLEKIWEAIIALPETIADWIADVLQWAFAPSETFIQSKVEALIAKYPTADTFSNLGNSLNAFFGGLGATPPIIYIDLGAFEGSYLLGGREVFLDLTWYSRYKPTVDAIIGAFIWLWLAWRVFLSIPSIIHGEAGSWGDRKTDIGASNTSGATIVHQRELSSGKK